MKIAAVTTFNTSGLELYGRAMMASFRAHWPEAVKLRVYTEGWTLGNKIEERDLLDASPWLAEFKARNGSRPFIDMRWDAVRFAHKVAALTHAAHDMPADVLIWLDGDIVTHAPVTVEDLAALAPKGDDWIAWLDRANQYPECGFYMINCRHRWHRDMITAFTDEYARDRLYHLDQWHDSYVLWKLVERARIGAKSLSGEGFNTAHPLVNGPLGRWFDHLKGGRKNEGRSRRTDLKTRRGEAYWQ